MRKRPGFSLSCYKHDGGICLAFGIYIQSNDFSKLNIFENSVYLASKRVGSKRKGSKRFVVKVLKLLTSLDEAKYDYSWCAGLKLFAEQVKKAHTTASKLHGLAVKKEKHSLLKVAIIKMRLLEGYKDADKLLLAYQRDYTVIIEKNKTKDALGEQAKEIAKKAMQEKIAAEKSHEEAVRAEKLKSQKAKADAERAKAASERATAFADELSEIAKKTEAEIEKYTAERLEAEIKKQESELRAYEAREKTRIVKEIADERARKEARARFEAQKAKIQSRISAFREVHRIKGSTGGRLTAYPDPYRAGHSLGKIIAVVIGSKGQRLTQEKAKKLARKESARRRIKLPTKKARAEFERGYVNALMFRE